MRSTATGLALAMDICAGTDDDFPDHDGTGYATAVHEAAHAVAVEWTGVGKAFGISTGLGRNRPWSGLHGQMRWAYRHAVDEAELLATEQGRALLRARLVVVVAAPLAVARVTGREDESWAGLVTAHLRDPLFGYLLAEPRAWRGTPDYITARNLCHALGITLAEALALGDAFLDEAGVMDAIVRVAEAVLATAPAYYLGREAFLHVLDLPASVEAHRIALWGADCEGALPRSPHPEHDGVSGSPHLLVYVLLLMGTLLMSSF